MGLPIDDPNGRTWPDVVKPTERVGRSILLYYIPPQLTRRPLTPILRASVGERRGIEVVKKNATPTRSFGFTRSGHNRNSLCFSIRPMRATFQTVMLTAFQPGDGDAGSLGSIGGKP